MTATKPITNHTADQSPASALWRIALSEYESEVAAYNKVLAEYEEAARLSDDEIAQHAKPFERFLPIDLRYVSDAVAGVTRQLLMERPTYGNGEVVSRSEHLEAQAEAVKIVADYSAYCDERQKIQETVYYPAEKKHDAACDKLSDAREKLFQTPAPSPSAMLAKMRILAAYVNECQGEDAERFNAVVADAERLFGEAA